MKNAKTHYEKGIKHEDAGRLEKAIAEFRLSAQDDPSNIEVYEHLADCLQELDREPEAVELWQEVVRAYPDSPRVHSDLGIAFGQNGQDVETLVEYYMALELGSDDAHIYFNIGLALMNLDRYEEAITICLNAVNRFPDEGRIHSILGDAYKWSHRYVEAISSYEKSYQCR